MKGLRQSINHYDRTVYEQTLKDFLVARCSVSYEKLFIGLLENEIRGMDEIAVHSVN